MIRRGGRRSANRLLLTGAEKVCPDLLSDTPPHRSSVCARHRALLFLRARCLGTASLGAEDLRPFARNRQRPRDVPASGSVRQNLPRGDKASHGRLALASPETGARRTQLGPGPESPIFDVRSEGLQSLRGGRSLLVRHVDPLCGPLIRHDPLCALRLDSRYIRYLAVPVAVSMPRWPSRIRPRRMPGCGPFIGIAVGLAPVSCGGKVGRREIAPRVCGPDEGTRRRAVCGEKGREVHPALRSSSVVATIFPESGYPTFTAPGA